MHGALGSNSQPASPQLLQHKLPCIVITAGPTGSVRDGSSMIMIEQLPSLFVQPCDVPMQHCTCRACRRVLTRMDSTANTTTSSGIETGMIVKAMIKRVMTQQDTTGDHELEAARAHDQAGV